MANRPALLKQADLTRYLKAVQAAGVSVGRVVIGKDGSVSIFPAGAGDLEGPNPCDRLLK